jgi:hypothetical protein
MKLLEMNILAAVDRLRTSPSSDHRPDVSRIRIVLDDWRVLLTTHPELAKDPKLLEAVADLLRRTGVTALLVGTQPGRPTRTVVGRPHDLQDLARLRLRPTRQCTNT